MTISPTDRIGLVWSGGGARGAYQLGLWKAMRELGIDKQVTVLTGTSIGAVNGVAFVQAAYDTCFEVWQNMDYNAVFDSIPKQENLSTGRVLYSLAKDFVRKRGISVDISRNRVKELTNETLLRSSKVDFGIVVYNWTKREGEKRFVDEIPEGMVADYVNASSNIPVFESLYINGDKYVDGGFAEVVPLSLCLRRAHKFDKLIIAQINSFPYQHLQSRGEIAGKEYVMFSPLRRIGSPADFSPAAIHHAIELGYQESMAALKVKLRV